LNASFHFPKVLILMAAACLAWIGLLSMSVVFIMGSSAATGWMIAGGLLIALLGGVAVIANEMFQAVDLLNDLASEEDIDGFNADVEMALGYADAA
jgi:hypothetical protein